MLMNLRDNLRRVRQRIAEAAELAGRSPEEVRLVAVTKYVDANVTRQLFELGCHDLGEARPQELLSKAEALADLPVRWHLIGHLQRNKAKRLLPIASLIHSGDSLRLLEEMDRLGQSLPKPVEVLLEVNISGDATKHGFSPGELEPLLPALAGLSRLRIAGLMAMSGLRATPEETRNQFDQVRELRDRLIRLAPGNMPLADLSLGMSDDLEIAIAAGATLVRVGSALFEE
jgi:pyridoxal phosphate enzyme (YggS family)